MGLGGLQPPRRLASALPSLPSAELKGCRGCAEEYESSLVLKPETHGSKLHGIDS